MKIHMSANFDKVITRGLIEVGKKKPLTERIYIARSKRHQDADRAASVTSQKRNRTMR